MQDASIYSERVLRANPLSRTQAMAVLAVRALGVARLALFGSVQRDYAKPDSDVDLLVQFDHFLALAELLERRLGHRVEFVTTESPSPIIGPRILAEAQDILRAA